MNYNYELTVQPPLILLQDDFKYFACALSQGDGNLEAVQDYIAE